MKRLFAALLCVLMLLAVFPASALAYSTTSTKGVELVYPDEKDYYTRGFEAKVKVFEGGKGIYLMPMPESGHGNLGSVVSGKTVTILGEKNGYFFFVTSSGHYGWNGIKWFDYKKYEVPGKNRGASGSNDYPTVSTHGVRLSVPKEADYFDSPITKTVKASRSDGAIYLMPKPKQGNGNLGTVNSGETVTVYAERNGYYYFETSDGRFGWNGTKWFK